MASSWWPISSRPDQRDRKGGDTQRASGDHAEEAVPSGAKSALRHPLAITAVGALIAGWLLPPFAHQWQDRRDERELKRELATRLDGDATATVIAAQLLLARQFPEAQTTNVRREDRNRASSPIAKRESAEAYAEAVERERIAATVALVDTVTEWLVIRSVSISTLSAYFPNDDLTERWKTYSNHVSMYLRLVSSKLPRAVREEHLTSLNEYLRPGSEGEQWSALKRQPASITPAELGAYGFVASQLAESLLDKKNAFVSDLLASHVDGFSTRPGDLLEELVPVL